MTPNNWRYGDFFASWYNLDRFISINVNGHKKDDICSVRACMKDECLLDLFFGSYEECEEWMHKFMKGE